MNYSLVATLAEVIITSVSVVALWIHGQRWRVALQTDILLKLTEQLYAPACAASGEGLRDSE